MTDARAADPEGTPRQRPHLVQLVSIAITIPERVDTVATTGRDVIFETTLDGYGEVWVDGELARSTGHNGGSVVAEGNAVNRLKIACNVKPGQKIQLAIFGINAGSPIRRRISSG